MNLKQLIADDISKVFLNVDHFADNLVIQIGTDRFNAIGSLQANTVENNSGDINLLQSQAYTLYMKYPFEDNLKLSAGTRLSINDVMYTVTSISDEMGLATIQLTSRYGR